MPRLPVAAKPRCSNVLSTLFSSRRPDRSMPSYQEIGREARNNKASLPAKRVVMMEMEMSMATRVLGTHSDGCQLARLLVRAAVEEPHAEHSALAFGAPAILASERDSLRRCRGAAIPTHAMWRSQADTWLTLRWTSPLACLVATDVGRYAHCQCSPLAWCHWKELKGGPSAHTCWTRKEASVADTKKLPADLSHKVGHLSAHDCSEAVWFCC